MKRNPKQAVLPDPAWRVDVLVDRLVDLLMKRHIDNHPLTARLRQVGLDASLLARNAVRDKLKRERITDVKSLRKALRRPTV
jgi:hypothetical protein